MAEYIIQDTTLTDIADAIREKDGSTDPIKVSDMATAISEIPAGGEIDTTALTTTNGQYLLSSSIYNFIVDNKLKNNVVIKPLLTAAGSGTTGYRYIQAKNLIPSPSDDAVEIVANDLSFVKFDCDCPENNVLINFSEISNNGSQSVMEDRYLLKFPTIVNKGDKKLYANMTSTWFTSGYSYVYQEDAAEIIKYLNNFDGICGHPSRTSNSTLAPDVFSSAMSLIDNRALADKVQELIDGDDTQLSANYTNGSYKNPSNGRYFRLPVLHGKAGAVTSNALSTFANSGRTYCTKSITFCTNNGQPYEVKWKAQTLDLATQDIGYTSNYSPTISGYDYKQLATQVYLGNSMQTAREAYDAHKDDPYYVVSTSYSATYEGKNRNLAKLFSLFNHDSAVELINSLPDTSAYLATAGGTNTLKLDRYCGACTDAGGCGDLTEDEIAVATNKGWTITFVD